MPKKCAVIYKQEQLRMDTANSVWYARQKNVSERRQGENIIKRRNKLDSIQFQLSHQLTLSYIFSVCLYDLLYQCKTWIIPKRNDARKESILAENVPTVGDFYWKGSFVSSLKINLQLQISCLHSTSSHLLPFSRFVSVEQEFCYGYETWTSIIPMNCCNAHYWKIILKITED